MTKFCIDCGKEIKGQKAKRCHPCAGKVNKISPACTMLGKHHTKESRNKISESHKRHPYWKHKHFSEEHKRKISLANKGKQFSKEYRKKLSLAGKGRKKSEETKRKLSLARRGKCIGEKNPNWRGGVSSEIAKRIYSWQWKEVKKQVYKRDGWTCQVCKKHCHEDIQCHHIVPYRITQDNNPENLITLCRSCHIKEEHKYYRSLKGQLILWR